LRSPISPAANGPSGRDRPRSPSQAWPSPRTASASSFLATRSYLVFLRQADELLRRIQTEALAMGFAAGAVFSLLYPLFAGLGAPRLGENVTAAVMMLSWGAASWIGTRRYAGGSGA